MRRTEILAITIEVADDNSVNCSPLCDFYDWIDTDYGKSTFCTLFPKETSNGLRCKECIKDFGISDE